MFRSPTLLLLALVLALAPRLPADEPDLAELAALQGVAQIEYHAPFLLVLVESETEIEAVKRRVAQALETTDDAELRQRRSRLALAYHHRPQDLKRHRQFIEQVKSADTRARFSLLCSEAAFCSLYRVDWKEAPQFTARRLFINPTDPPHPLLVEQELAATAKRLPQLAQLPRPPQQLLCLTLDFVGTLVFPVTDGKIRSAGAEIPLQPVLRALEKDSVNTPAPFPDFR